MSRTTKWEHKSDTIRDRHAEKRKARPAGRLVKEIREQEEAAAE